MKQLRNNLLPLVLSLFAAIVYFCFRTKNYYWDGVEFAAQIENAPVLAVSLLHPSHLVYNVFGSVWFACARIFDPQIRALDVLQAVNCLLAACCVFVLLRILKSALRSDYLAAVFAALFAFSATWWKFATDADAYVPCLLFLLTAFYFLLPERRPRPLLIAALLFIALMFHQLAIFFVPAAMLAIYFQSSRERRFKNVLRCVAAAGFLTLGSYAAAFWAQTRGFSVRDFVRWTTYYSPENGFGATLAGNFGYTLRGHTRLFFDGRFNFFKFGANPLTTTLFVCLIISFLILIIQTARRYRDFRLLLPNAWASYQERRKLVLLGAVWAAVYIAFLFFFIPQNTFYRLLYVPALIILAATAFGAAENSTPHKRQWRLALFVATIALANFLFFIEPYSRMRNETPLLLAKQLNAVWSPNTIIYFNFDGTDNSLIRYFNQGTSWQKLDAGNLDLLTAEIERQTADGKNVWLDESALTAIRQNPRGVEWLAQHTREAPRYKLNDPAYQVQFVRVTF